ncbi:unnamed protein product, partial [Vitis vinifera]
MAVNNNNPPKNLGASSSPFGNAGMGSPAMPANPAHQAHVIAQAHSKAQAHAQAQAQAAHAQFQAQLQAQGMTLNQSQGIGIGNMGGSSPSIGAPGNSNMKRTLQKPPVRPPGPLGANTISPLKVMELTPAARRKKQKLPEKQLQDRVAAILPESALYTQLLEFESRPPTWTLKIIGRILEEGVDPDQAAMLHKSNVSYPKFSSFFKRVTISLDQRLYPDNPIIIWENARSPAPHEGFEVKRKGDKEFTVNIRLEMNYVPEKFKLSSALMEVLGIEVDTRPRIIAAIWHYVKARKLQNPNDPSFFNCDPPLQKVFGEDKMKFTMVSQKISQHLSPPQPIHLEHKIKLSGNCPAGNACYDVLVDVPFPIQKELSALLANTEKNKEIDACDEAICSAIRKIHEHRRRRAFFLGFSQSPVEFINTLIESQSKDLKLVAGEASRNAEKERRSDFFNQPWVEDAVIRYLNRKPVAGSDAPGST